MFPMEVIDSKLDLRSGISDQVKRGIEKNWNLNSHELSKSNVILSIPLTQ